MAKQNMTTKANEIFVGADADRAKVLGAKTTNKVKEAGAKLALVFLMNGVAFGYFGDSMYKKRTHDIHVNHPTVFVGSLSTWSLEGMFSVILQIQNDVRHLLDDKIVNPAVSDLVALMNQSGRTALRKAIISASMPFRIEQNEAMGRYDALTSGLYEKLQKVVKYADDAVDIDSIAIKKAWLKSGNHDLLDGQASITVGDLLAMVEVDESWLYKGKGKGQRVDYGEVKSADDYDI